MTQKETVDHLKKVRKIILADERMGYKTADVFINAPLALIQMGMTNQLHLCEKALGLKPTKVPIKK